MHAGPEMEPADLRRSARDEQVCWILETLTARDQTLAVAESLTGGSLAARFVEVPGASSAFRGAVVAYAADLKTTLLGVSADLLATNGPVDPRVVAAMAEGVAVRLSATFGVATTGVAGPSPHGGIAPGTAYVAVARRGDTRVSSLQLSGDRASVREQAADEALALLVQVLREAGADDGEHGV